MDDERRRLASSRQAARIRLARVKRWVTGGALALTGLLSAVAAQWLPSSQAKQPTGGSAATATATPSKQSTQSTQSAPSAQPDQQQSSSTIAPAASAPQASSSGSGAVSGGS